MSSASVYRGPWGPRQAERLLWRAGFGPRPGDVETFSRLGLRGSVRRLLRPPTRRLRGPAPHVQDDKPLAPRDVYGHDQLWWLDRMVRTDAPLVERMTLIWHDWFATSRDAVPTPKFMLDQNQLLRTHALGSFRALTLAVTTDPAMLLWLSGAENTKDAPNENYARELMELFTLGAGAGYTERDVREQARALTGWTTDWDDVLGPVNFHFDPDLHDPGRKRVFGRTGAYDWRDAVELCLDHPAHAGFVVRKLWSMFIPTPPGPATLRRLTRLYRSGGTALAPVVEAILLHPALHRGPRMVKPPVVQLAGMLRARDRGIDTETWTWVGDLCGQELFAPPNVAGWDDSRWLDTATWRGRWIAAGTAAEPFAVKDDERYLASVGGAETPGEAVRRALAFWGRPFVSAATTAELLRFATEAAAAGTADWERQVYPALRQNALRQMIASSPDYLTC